MDPTNIIMFLLVFCVTGAMAVDPQAQKNQWNVLTGVTVWNGKPQHEFRINWFHVLCGRQLVRALWQQRRRRW